MLNKDLLPIIAEGMLSELNRKSIEDCKHISDRILYRQQLKEGTDYDTLINSGRNIRLDSIPTQEQKQD